MDVGRLDAAIDEFGRALQAAQKSLGIHHNQTLILWNDWIGCLLRNHDFYRGISELKKLLAVRKKVNGLDSPQTLETWYAYAYYLYAT